MTSVLPGGDNFGGMGWRDGTVKSLVLLTDEECDTTESSGDRPVSDYTDFWDFITNLGYLNNIIVSDRDAQCEGLGGTSLDDGCEYFPSTNPPVGAAFDLVDFTENTDAFLQGFISTKVGELQQGDPTGGSGNVIPLPASAWFLLAGFGGLAAMRRRQKA